MKRCSDCNLVFEDQLDICSSCGTLLEPMPTSYPTGQSGVLNHSSSRPQATSAPRMDTIPFDQGQGRSIVLNGAVAEISTQQYYQSRLTKWIQAILAGEPYQLSHTSFMTIVRVEQHVQRGFPEHSRDVTLHGNMQNILSPGDDVTVWARRSRGRLVARRIHDHSTDSHVRTQPQIPASVIRWLTLFAVISIALLIAAVLTADYSFVYAAIGSLLSALAPAVICILLLRYLIKGKL